MFQPVAAECVGSTYGENCESFCNSNCKQISGRTCDKVIGDCLAGCKDIAQASHNDWWLGNKCDIFIREYSLDLRHLYLTRAMYQ